MRIAVVALHTDPVPTYPLPTSTDDLMGQVTALSTGLSRLDHEVVVYAHPPAPRAPGRVRAPGGYDVVHVGGHPTGQDETGRLHDSVRLLERHWHDEAPDVVHAHDWTSGVAAVLAARDRSLPVVQSFHDLGVRLRRTGGAVHPKRVEFERMIGRRAAHVIAHRAVGVEDLLGIGVPRTRVSRLDDGIDVDRFTPEGPRDGRRLRHRVVSVGRLHPESGLDGVVGALSAVRDAELVIVGTPGADARAEVGRLTALARAHGVHQRIRLATDTPPPALPGLLRSADLLVSAGRRAACHGVLEAMACGVPVVATAGSAAADLVVDGVTGVVVPPADRRELVRTLRRLLDSPALRDAYGTAGADRVKARFSPTCVAENATRVYASVVEPAAPEALQDAAVVSRASGAAELE